MRNRHVLCLWDKGQTLTTLVRWWSVFTGSVFTGSVFTGSVLGRAVVLHLPWILLPRLVRPVSAFAWIFPWLVFPAGWPFGRIFPWVLLATGWPVRHRWHGLAGAVQLLSRLVDAPALAATLVALGRLEGAVLRTLGHVRGVGHRHAAHQDRLLHGAVMLAQRLHCNDRGMTPSDRYVSFQGDHKITVVMEMKIVCVVLHKVEICPHSSYYSADVWRLLKQCLNYFLTWSQALGIRVRFLNVLSLNIKLSNWARFHKAV